MDKLFTNNLLVLITTLLLLSTSLSSSAEDIQRVSVDSSGVEGNDQSTFPSLSADGRYVAFESDASNLVAGDTNGIRDVSFTTVTPESHHGLTSTQMAHKVIRLVFTNLPFLPTVAM